MMTAYLQAGQYWAVEMENNGLEPDRLTDQIVRDKEGNILTYPLTPERNLWQETAV